MTGENQYCNYLAHSVKNLNRFPFIDYKQASAGGFAPHFDAPGYNHIKAQKHLTILIAVEDATLDNGCLEVVPGSHASTIPINPDKTITDEWTKSKNWVPVPLKTGQYIIISDSISV
jgi:ectoine hydroxylase-related dioxygenase (phytanoyl-CoA dioxygenase family)